MRTMPEIMTAYSNGDKVSTDELVRLYGALTAVADSCGALGPQFEITAGYASIHAANCRAYIIARGEKTNG